MIIMKKCGLCGNKAMYMVHTSAKTHRNLCFKHFFHWKNYGKDNQMLCSLINEED